MERMYSLPICVSLSQNIFSQNICESLDDAPAQEQEVASPAFLKVKSARQLMETSEKASHSMVNRGKKRPITEKPTEDNVKKARIEVDDDIAVVGEVSTIDKVNRLKAKAKMFQSKSKQPSLDGWPAVQAGCLVLLPLNQAPGCPIRFLYFPTAGN